MLTPEALQDLMADMESDRVERTVSTQDTRKFRDAICAFANDLPRHGLPGYLLVGVTDGGRPSGLEVTDKLQQQFAGYRDDGHILPMPTLNVARVPLPNGRHAVLVVEVLPSDMPPVRHDGQVCVRVGPRRGYASESEERLLTERRTASARTFDARVCPGATLDDLDLDLFRRDYLPAAVAPEVLAENHRELAHQLASLGFYDLRAQAPTHCGVLVLGKRVTDFLPGAYLQVVRYQGDSVADEVGYDRALSGDLLTVLRALDTLLESQIVQRPEAVSALREVNVTDYPVVALRELCLNAVMHRSYEATAPTRLEWFDSFVQISNPGGLYGEARPENFPNQTAYRNPRVAEAMKVLGYVNKFGRGVARARAALERNGNPAPEFLLSDPHRVAVVVRRPS
jgi:ATP-dependent DNA helicase RecG